MLMLFFYVLKTSDDTTQVCFCLFIQIFSALNNTFIRLLLYCNSGCFCEDFWHPRGHLSCVCGTWGHQYVHQCSEWVVVLHRWPRLAFTCLQAHNLSLNRRRTCRSVGLTGRSQSGPSDEKHFYLKPRCSICGGVTWGHPAGSSSAEGQSMFVLPCVALRLHSCIRVWERVYRRADLKGRGGERMVCRVCE